MKSLTRIVIVLLTSFLISSCGISTSMMLNQNQIATQVQLTGNNYKVIDKVSGQSKATYVFGFGGIKKKQLYENAYSAMMDNAKLVNTSRAVVNVVTEEHIGGLPPIYIRRTVTVSAHVIEFTK